jgi:hypothetical protein
MHIHGMPLNSNSALLYSAAAAEKAAETQRATETRKRLLRAADATRAAASLDDTVFIGHWLGFDTEHETVELTYGPGDGRHFSSF